MLAVSSERYNIPVRWRSQNDVQYWSLYYVGHMDMTVSAKFNYTFEVAYWDDHHNLVFDRMTYSYSGKSVKPSGRTLRKFGNELTSQIVSVLSSTAASESMTPTEYSVYEFEKIHNILDSYGYILNDGKHVLS